MANGIIVHNSESINMQNLSSGRDGKGARLRESITAPDGYRLISIDLSQIECSTWDTFVVVKRGIIPITEVTLDDMLWDGEEWVSHQGVVFKGYKEVIEYDGLRATPDHVVYLRGGTKTTFINAQLDKASLAIGERNGQTVRYVEGVGQTYPIDWQGVSVLPMRVWDYSAGVYRRFARWVVKKLRLSFNESILSNIKSNTGTPVTTAVQPDNDLHKWKNQESGVSKLREAWYSEQVRKLRSVYSLCTDYYAQRRFHRLGNRSYRQSWALRAWESSVGYARRKCTETRMQSHDFIQRSANEYKQICTYLCAKLRTISCIVYDQKRNLSRADYIEECTARGTHCLVQTGEYISNERNGLVAVYDIVNAGPRFRFTANGKIISNCRLHAWSWDEHELLSDFANNQDPYSKLASEIYGVHVDKNGPFKHLRHVGKEGELSLGFGVGAKKFFHTIKTKYGQDAGDFTLEDAERTVKLYRDKRQGIVAGWKELEKMMTLMCAKEAGYRFKIWYFDNESVIMPNDLRIHYKKIHWVRDPQSGFWNCLYQHGKDWSTLYPAKFSEMLTQTTARCVVAEHAIEISKYYKIVLLVHDEIVFLAPEAEADEALAYGLQVMRTAPKWCSTLPLDAEGKHARIYSK